MSLFDEIQEMAAEGYQMVREAQGVECVTFEDRSKVAVLTVADHWMFRGVTDQASGIAEIEVNILPQDAVTESVLADDVRFAVIKNRRHEKRTYEYRTDAPERHQLRFQAIGEAV